MSKTSGRDTWKRDAVLVVVLVLVAAGLITYLLAKPPGRTPRPHPGSPRRKNKPLPRARTHWQTSPAGSRVTR
ncbi:hypothetical protein ACFSVJ_22325 [Prauserella oleivorans]